ncbi:hypothetical protein RD792_016811 [Penstemon davidsonii]|uniref:Uncharacterized protein n=1 Tax=Penstemon davidsonii TaxID=160366 RepID=A0ABR0CM90_9LAMI|nr:hypothetical protein RD792_016811 [Penstemon davidsonii]
MVMIRAMLLPNHGQPVPYIDDMKDAEDVYNEEDKTSVGSAEYLVEVENNRAVKVERNFLNATIIYFKQVFGKTIWLGLSVTFFGGVCYSLFSPALNLATNDQFHMVRRGVPHLVAFFYFSLSFFIIAIILNITFLYQPVRNIPKSSMKSYLNDWNGRNWALLAGVMCGLGNGLQFMGGQAAGYAAADCVQALLHILGHTMSLRVPEIV